MEKETEHVRSNYRLCHGRKERSNGDKLAEHVTQLYMRSERKLLSILVFAAMSSRVAREEFRRLLCAPHYRYPPGRVHTHLTMSRAEIS